MINIKQLPDELIDLIFLNLPSVDVAIAQQTCKQWYVVAQNHPKLWRNTRSFFEKYYPVTDEYMQMKHARDVKREKEHNTHPQDVCIDDGRKKFFDGLEALIKLSEKKLDVILIDFGCFHKDDESKILHSKQYYWSRQKVQKVLDFISISEAKVLWIKDDLCTHFSKRHRNGKLIKVENVLVKITPVPKSVMGCSKLTELKLTTVDESLRFVPAHPAQGQPFATCKLKTFDTDGRFMYMLHNEEQLFEALQGIEHFRLRCDGWISDANTLFGFLSRIGSSLKTLEIFGTKYSDMSTHYLGQSPILNDVEVMLPNVTQIALLAKFYDSRDDDVDDDGNLELSHRLSEEQAARVRHNHSINHVLVCRNLQTLTIERTFPDRPMLLADRIESLKLIDIKQEGLKNVLRHIPKFDSLTFQVRCIERLKGIQQFQSLPETITSFEVDLSIYDCDENICSWLEDRMGTLKSKSTGTCSSAQDVAFCNLTCKRTTKMSSSASTPIAFSKNEWIYLVKELQKSELKCCHHHDECWDSYWD